MKISEGFKQFELLEENAAFKNFAELIDWLKRKKVWESPNSLEKCLVLEEQYKRDGKLTPMGLELEPKDSSESNLAFYVTSSLKIVWRVMEQMQKLPDHLLPRGEIKEALQYEILPEDEILNDPNCNGRNKLNNLEIASYIMEAGKSIVGFDDVNFIHDKYEILIECKRIHSFNQLGSKIKIASNQVAPKCDNVKKFPVLFLSIEKAFNRPGKVFAAERAGGKIKEAMNHMMSLWVKENADVLISARRSKFIGVVIHYKIPVLFENNLLRTYTGLYNFSLFQSRYPLNLGYHLFNEIF